MHSLYSVAAPGNPSGDEKKSEDGITTRVDSLLYVLYVGLLLENVFELSYLFLKDESNVS